MTDRFEVIGHVPVLMATWLIKEKRVNRGVGYGLEVPCEYLFEGDSFCYGWL